MMRLRNEQGQSMIFAVLALVGVLGMAALVIDVGAWFRAHRDAQATADAAALAGAQFLPHDPGSASAQAIVYGARNGGGVAGADITITSTMTPADTISVHATKPAPTFISRILAFADFTVGARATARAGLPAEALYVAPMVVSKDHPHLAGSGCPCFGQSTNLDFQSMGAPGAFGMLNLEGGNGTAGTPELADWILNGFGKALPLGDYRSDPGAKFSSSQIQDALDERIGTVLLFPVFSKLTGSGQNAKYTIIGWVGFKLSSYTVHGNNATLRGTFVTYLARGLPAITNSGQPNFGARIISLIE